MRIYATYNIKGGVGKTTTAVNLAFLAAESGLRTVLWDLDPQGAASFMFRVKPKVKGGGKALIKGKRPLDDAIKGTDFDNLDLIPADFTYRNMDLLLEAASNGGGGRRRSRRQARPQALQAARAAGRRVRRGLPRLPAVGLPGVGERAARGRCHRRPAHPDDAFRANARAAGRFRGRVQRPPAGAARVLLDGRSPQETAQGNNGKAFCRTDRGGSHRHTGSVGHRDDVGGARPGRRLRA